MQTGDLQGILAISGMTGALIALPAMKALPFGVPKLLISSAVALPIHAEQFAKYFARQRYHRDARRRGYRGNEYPGPDTRPQWRQCHFRHGGDGQRLRRQEQKPSIAITEFGFCDKGAHYIRELLEKDFEIVSFHATGLGDQAAMELIPQGLFKAFIDLVPGAFSEYLLGGNRGTSGPGSPGYRLQAADPLYLLSGRLRHHQLRPD